MHRSTLLFFAAAGLATAAPAAATTTTYTDSDFTTGTYTTAFTEVSTPGNALVPAQCLTCGVGGTSAEQITIAFVGTTPGAVNQLGLLNNGFVYDPSTSGAISSIDASVDKNFTVFTGLLYNNAFRPLIAQGGNFYEAVKLGTPLQGPGTTGFATFTLDGLTAANFSQVDTATGAFDPNSHPDFAGGALTFGFAQLLGESNVPGPQAQTVYDNLRFAVSSVPEPASWAMMIAGFGGIGGLMRRRPARTLAAA